MVDFGSHFGEILRSCWICLRFDENSKNRTAPRREHQNQGSGGSNGILESIQKRIKKQSKNHEIFDGFLVGFGRHFGPKIHRKINKKID